MAIDPLPHLLAANDAHQRLCARLSGMLQAEKDTDRRRRLRAAQSDARQSLMQWLLSVEAMDQQRR